MTVEVAGPLGFQFWKYDQHVIHDLRLVVFDERGTLVSQTGAEPLESALAVGEHRDSTEQRLSRSE